jgi:trk system potassium uptake protein TrkA
MKKQFAVIGLGKFGSAVATSLAEQGFNVIAVDSEERRVKALVDSVTLAVQLDALDEQALREAGIANVDVAIVSIGQDIAASMLAVVILKDIGIKEIIAKAVNELHGRVLRKIGVKRVIYPEKDMAIRLAKNLTGPEFLEQIELSPDYSIVEVSAPSFVWDKRVKDSDLRSGYGISIIAILGSRMVEGREEHIMNINPYPDDVIKKGDIIVLLGADKDIARLQE